jgi:vancomycin resistance protein YoaR
MGANVSRWKLAAFLLVTAGAVGGAAWGFARAKRQVAVSVQGAAPGQHVVSEPVAWARFVDVRAERLAEREVHVTVLGDAYAFSQRKLGYELNRAALGAAFAREKALQGAAPRALPWQERAEAVELPVSYDFDEAEARATLGRLAARVHRAPVDARVLVREHRVVRAQAGVELDVDATLERLREADPKEGLVVQAAMREIAPRITDDMVVAIDVSQILSSFETDFRKKAPSRAVNIARAAAYLDQQILRPGEVFSFNRTVGERTHERGFIDAPVIVNDELERGVGGGVCQVASTFHAAVRFANLEVLERRSHSRPTGYAPLGLDAVVIDGKQDLRVRNTYDTPLLIHAYLPSKYVIRVELLGRKPEATVEHDIAVKETKPFTRRVWHKDDVEPTSVKRKQEGTKGYDILSVLTIRHADGREERRTYPSMYYPVPEVFWIGRQTDLSALPALPEGASETLVDPVMPDPMGTAEPVSTTANPSGLGPSEPLL